MALFLSQVTLTFSTKAGTVNFLLKFGGGVLKIQKYQSTTTFLPWYFSLHGLQTAHCEEHGINADNNVKINILFSLAVISFYHMPITAHIPEE